LRARFSAPVQAGTGAHPGSCKMGTRSLSGVKSDRGVTLTPHPLVVPWSMKGYSYTSTPPMGRTACTKPQCLYRGALYNLLSSTLSHTSSFLTLVGMFSLFYMRLFYFRFLCSYNLSLLYFNLKYIAVCFVILGN